MLSRRNNGKDETGVDKTVVDETGVDKLGCCHWNYHTDCYGRSNL